MNVVVVVSGTNGVHTASGKLFFSPSGTGEGNLSLSLS